jgi:hypothetical protein
VKLKTIWTLSATPSPFRERVGVRVIKMLQKERPSPSFALLRHPLPKKGEGKSIYNFRIIVI